VGIAGKMVFVRGVFSCLPAGRFGPFFDKQKRTAEKSIKNKEQINNQILVTQKRKNGTADDDLPYLCC
jgi:hypothetical protein